MSWYVGADIYQKDKNGWKCLVANKYHLPLKQLCENRSQIDDNIFPCDLSDDDKKSLEELVHEHDYEEEVFIGKIEEEVFLGMNLSCFHKGEKLMVNEEDVEKVQKKCIELKDYVNLDSKEVEEKYVDVYYIKIEERGYGNGRFYNVESFSTFIENLEDRLLELNKKKETKERIESSLDYLKLSCQEKQNVMDEFDYLDEDILETKSRLSAANTVVSVLEFFSEDDFSYKDMVVYLFSD